MLFLPLGDTNGIGASCHYVRFGDTGILLDAGADPEEDGPASLPDLALLRRNPEWYVDHAVVTHAHHDHMGSLPHLIQNFPHALIHMTRVTRQFVDILLPASAKLQRRRQREGSSPHDPLFSEEELDVFSYLYLTHELGERFDLTGIRAQTAVKGCFYNAGHVLGAAGVLITYAEDGQERRVFYTSDTNTRPQIIIPGGEYPEPPLDVLILESTLAADPEAELTTRRTEEQRFGEALQRVLGRGGAVLLPVFALGRAQEVLALVNRFKQRGIIDPDTPVYTAGSMRSISDVYDKSRFTTPRLDAEVQMFGIEQRRVPRSLSGQAAALAEPGIFIMSSGMMFERTASNALAQLMVSEAKHGIFLVGYAKEGSPAHQLLEAAKLGPETPVTLSTGAEAQPLRCEVDRFRFSGHSHRRDLIEIVEKTQPRQVILVHGEDEARHWMAENIRFFYPDIEVHVPDYGTPLTI